MNILLIGVVLLGVACMIRGYMKGFIRIVISLVATIATLFLVGIFSPIVADMIIDMTPLDGAIETKFETTLFGDEVYTTDLETISEELTLAEQISIIEGADIPEFLKEALLDNNNSEIYEQLGVDTFVDYIGTYLSSWVINTMAFIITFLIVWILVRVVIFSLDVVAELPLLHGINRGIGTILGLGVAVIIVWVGFLGLAIVYSSEIGQMCYLWIDESALLTMLYDSNPLINMLL